MTHIDVVSMTADELETIGTSFIRRGYASGGEIALKELAHRAKKCESPEVIDTNTEEIGE